VCNVDWCVIMAKKLNKIDNVRFFKLGILEQKVLSKIKPKNNSKFIDRFWKRMPLSQKFFKI